MQPKLSPAAQLVLDALQELKDMGYTFEILQELKRTGQLSPITELFPNRIWLGSEELLKLFFSLLQSDLYRLISKKETWENFRAIFLTGDAFKPIRWLGTITQLVEIFDRLWRLDDLDEIPILKSETEDQKHVFIQGHFHNKHGNAIALGTLRTSLCKRMRIAQHINVVEAILKEIEKRWAMNRA